MPNIHYDDNVISLQDDETVLEALLREGYERPFRCLKGVCQTCVMQSTEGTPTETSQESLNAAQKELGYFLPCCCKPSEDLTIEESGTAAEKVECKVIEVTPLNQKVLRIRCEPNLNYRSGQFVTVINSDNIGRSYSLASTPSLDDFIEFQIKCVDEGVFSQWAFNSLKAGDNLTLEGPFGHCIYAPASRQNNLLLVGMGTGLAPLYGVVRDALQQGHEGKIDLLVGARLASQLYLLEELSDLQNKYDNFSFTAITQQLDDEHKTSAHNESSSLSQIIEGDLYERLKEAHSDLHETQLYICGAESFIRKVRKHGFSCGLKMHNMLIDSFIPTGL